MKLSVFSMRSVMSFRYSRWSLCSAGAVLDLDWQTNARFASCSRDKSIIICELDSEDAICTLNGHTVSYLPPAPLLVPVSLLSFLFKDEVNSIKWDPQGRILASASNDCTVKLWSVGADHRLRHDLTAHDGEVTSVKWSPTGPTTSFPNAPLYLASASQDDTVRLWDIEGGVCTRVFTGHNMALSPDGRFIAAGSDDNHVRMWSVQVSTSEYFVKKQLFSSVFSFPLQSEKLLQFYRSTSPFLDVSWNSTGTLVAACSAEGSVRLFILSEMLLQNCAMRFMLSHVLDLFYKKVILFLYWCQTTEYVVWHE